VTPAEAAVNDPTRPSTDVPPPTTTPENTTPVSVNETLTYSQQLEGPTPPPDDDLAPPKAEPKVAEKTVAKSAKPVTRPGDERASAAAAAKPGVAPAPEPTATGEPPGNGWAVQVQAVKTRNEADTIARRLSAKGYPTFVTLRGAGIYGVRVGKFPSKREAEAVKARLEKDEQFKPWVTR
jgi:cell division septation protein DedD